LKRFFRHFHSSLKELCTCWETSPAEWKATIALLAAGRVDNKMKPYTSNGCVFQWSKLPTWQFSLLLYASSSCLYGSICWNKNTVVLSAKVFRDTWNPKRLENRQQRRKYYILARFYITSVFFLQDESRSTQFLFLCFPFFVWGGGGGGGKFHPFTK
jgi:hypothetical protein